MVRFTRRAFGAVLGVALGAALVVAAEVAVGWLLLG